MTDILPEPLTAEMPPPYPGGIAAEADTPADTHAPGLPKPADCVPQADRPGWIPPHILYNWDTDPYAYQTEEELMPAGGPHGRMLNFVMKITDDLLRTKNLMLLPDVFLLYRDARGKKQRVGPDLLLMPFRFPAPSSYNLDRDPLPPFVAEITSSKSRAEDTGDKAHFYAGLGIPAYLVIELHTSRGRLRDEIRLHLWRRSRGGVLKMQADADSRLPVPEMGVRIRAEGQRLVFWDIVTDEMLCDTGQLRERAEQAETRAEQEAARAERLAAKLRELGISPDEV